MARVLEAARDGGRTIERLSGADRYHLYLTAFGVGFRAGELAKRTPESFDLEGDTPTVTLPGRQSKNKRSVRQPIPPGVAAALRSYLGDEPAGKPVWPGAWPKHAAKILRVDLAAGRRMYPASSVRRVWGTA